MKNQEYYEGYLAYDNGDSDSDNPYSHVTDRQKWGDWLEGWITASHEDLSHA